ncbi:hypothetical protein GN958_ATG12955 [Phytophthora infestans]|uniref:Uncharacterized protein n=1 Tax=Phytophthora infestans TaxID=4787 RepID=A0A8S9UEU2_PHYIN|nr:hypothetical protein GN958_ATG12955 [Phytophthora infestans]
MGGGRIFTGDTGLPDTRAEAYSVTVWLLLQPLEGNKKNPNRIQIQTDPLPSLLLQVRTVMGLDPDAGAASTAHAAPRPPSLQESRTPPDFALAQLQVL